MGDLITAVAGLSAIVVIGLSIAGRLSRSLAPVRRPAHEAHGDEPRPPTGHRTLRRSPRRSPQRSTSNGRWRRSASDEIEVARWCDDLSRRVRGGDSLLVALTESTTGPAGIVAGITTGTDRGIPLAIALAAQRGRSTALDHALAVIITCAELGSPAAPALDRTAAVLRDRAAVRAERRTHSASARWSATVLTVLPGAAMVLMAITSPAMRAALVSSVGLVCIPLGLVANGIGWLWMRRIVDRVTP